MKKIPFCHLHLHTEYSLRNSTCNLNGLITYLRAYGHKFCAMTDAGSLYGALDFYSMARTCGIQPVIGCEVQVAEAVGSARLVLLAETPEGYRNLMQLVSLSHLEGFRSIGKKELQQYHKGLIGLSGGLEGAIFKNCAEGNTQQAILLAREYAAIFGPDCFFLEIQDHGLPEQKTAKPHLLEVAKTTGLPLVATNDVHYLAPDDYKVTTLMQGLWRGDDRPFGQAAVCRNDQFYLKKGEEMQALFPDLPEALSNTVKIAQRCHVDLSITPKHVFPELPRPSEFSSKLDYLVHLGRDGLRKRYANRVSSEAFEKASTQLHYEMAMAGKSRSIDRFLIVQDIVRWAKEQGIPVSPGMGREAGSMLAYALGITEVDPLQFNLTYERFERPARATQPDFDLDFCHERRSEVIEYIRSKYGNDHVAKIIVLRRFAPQSVVRNAGRLLGRPEEECARLAQLVPNKAVTFWEAWQTGTDLRNIPQTDPAAREVIRFAQTMGCLPYDTDIHAAALVISGIPLMELVPLTRVKNSAMPVVQFEKGRLEDMGFMTLDILSLRPLTAMQKVLDAIGLEGGQKPDLSNLPPNDPKTFELLRAADTNGIFPLEDAKMREALQKKKPTCIEELVSVLAGTKGCRCHAAARAVLAYQAAYLKANFPKQWQSAHGE